MSWLTRFGSWLCSGCNKSSGQPATSDGAQLPTPELTSLSRSVSLCSSLTTSKYTRCVTCNKTLLSGPSGSIECKRCSTERKEDLALQARRVQVEAEKLQSQKTQARRNAKPLFRKKPCLKIRTEKIHPLSSDDHEHMTSTPLVNFGGLPRLEEKSQGDLPSRKRKHGKA